MHSSNFRVTVLLYSTGSKTRHTTSITKSTLATRTGASTLRSKGGGQSGGESCMTTSRPSGGGGRTAATRARTLRMSLGASAI